MKKAHFRKCMPYAVNNSAFCHITTVDVCNRNTHIHTHNRHRKHLIAVA